jgi:hypothetical protein
MTKTIRVVHAVRPASKPEDYILVKPEGIGEIKAVRIVKCPFGPLVLWRVNMMEATKCPACSGTGELEARGDDGEYYECECPKCDGFGEVDVEVPNAGMPGVWSDACGNIIEPEMIQHASSEETISERWLADWVRKQQWVQS